MGRKSWRAVTNYRDFDGRTRRVERHGETAAKAERRLVEDLTKRARMGRQGEITPDTKLEEAARMWFADLERQDRADTTLAAYDDSLRLHVLPSLGRLRLREISVGVADRFVTSIRENVGSAAARRCRTVLSGILSMAARRDAVDYNPVREVSAIISARSPARSLSLEEVRALRAGLGRDLVAVQRDVPALVDFMLATGLRIGEVLAVTWDALDLDRATVEVRGTVVRRPGAGGLYIKQRPKTRAGWRQLHLPEWLVVSLRARERVENDWNVVFPSQQGKLRDRSNTNADIRDALDPLGYDWITSHTFRKTAATLLNDGGLTVREVADQLGHSRVSLTQDVYFGRGSGTRRAAEVLGAINEHDPKSVG
jgi:integrase